MSDRGYAILVTAAKYVLINFLAFLAVYLFASWGWFSDGEPIVLFFAIVNAAALILGKQQKILDKLNELSPAQNEE